MKKIFFALLISFLAGTAAWSSDIFEKESSFSLRKMLESFPASFTASAPLKIAAADLPLNLPPADALAYLAQSKPILLDVRTAEEYAGGHLKDSTLMDCYAADFKEQLGKLDKAAKYLIYCRSGGRSGRVLEMMAELGFTDAHDIKGGIIAWNLAGYLIVK